VVQFHRGRAAVTGMSAGSFDGHCPEPQGFEKGWEGRACEGLKPEDLPAI